MPKSRRSPGLTDPVERVADAIDSVLQWRDTVAGIVNPDDLPGWPDNDYREMAQAALDALHMAEYEAVVAAAKRLHDDMLPHDYDPHWSNLGTALARLDAARSQAGGEA